MPSCSILFKLAPRPPLPHNSVPLHFSLLPSLRSSTSPTPCLVANLPFRHPAGEEQQRPPNRHVEVQDLRQGAEVATVQVVRILDPEHREPFVSLARIFLAVGISPLQGLLLYPELRRPAFDSTLAGIAPFIDIWVPLKTARAIAESLGVLDELAGLLEWETRRAFSVEDREEGGMVHNWKIGSDRIDPARYSTSAMLSTSFPRIHLLPSNTQVRTLLPTTPTVSPFLTSFPTSFAALYSHIIDWTVNEYESYLDDDDSSPHPLSPSTSSSSLTRRSSTTTDLTPSLLFTTLLSLLSLTSQITLDEQQPHGSVYPLPNLPIARAEIISGGEEGWRKGRLGLVDALGKMVGREWRLEREREVLSRRGVGPAEEGADGRPSEVESRLEKLEQALEELRVGASRVEVQEEEGEIEPDALLSTLPMRVEQLERQLERIAAEQNRQARALKPRWQQRENRQDGGQINMVVLLLVALLMAVAWPSVKDFRL